MAAQSLLLRKPFAVPGQQTVVPNCPGSGEELKPPSTLTANSSHVLSTTLDVTLQSKQVPVYVKSNNVWTCSMQTFSLRMYTDPVTGQPKYPGPTLLVQRETSTYTPGDQIQVLLKNSLPPDNDDCTPPAADGMNCFHGDNTTNLHFHGTHVSPQSPQDYVLLQLTPPGDTSTAAHGDVVSTQFQYAVNPLPSNQSEGTHWYHPHKHGSTAQQVGNGMAGALIIKGPFDDWLQQQYGGKLREKLLVIQQVHELNFTSGLTPITPLPMINGQLVPQITMYKGEIQRWRLVNANTDATAQFTIDFNGVVDDNIQAKQIAMDGVQFSPKNYECQPLIDPTPCDGAITDLKFQFSPGNRADFLIKAPTSVGEFFVPYEIFGNIDEQGQALTGAQRRLGRDRRPRTAVAETRAALDAVAPGASQPALLSINVVDCPQGMNCDMQFPATVPDLPDFLRPIVPKGDPQQVQFQITPNDGIPPAPANLFGVWVKGQNDDKMQQFRADCAAFTEVLDPDGGEEWHVSQNVDTTQPFHVFHIHTNPFQVVSTGDANGNTITYPEPIWHDSITLPTNKNPNDPNNPKGKVVLRQRFEDYTGMYVLHCHFLGHEDRGMMLSVQTVCPNQPDSWSVTSATQKECTFGQFTLARKPCSPASPAPHAH
jgi:FtsP/CotA-like multicopper oxidase with cupredoxin domain